jgi:myo-inositol-1(or 4)-monophosphatase
MTKSPVLTVVDAIFRKAGKSLLRDYFELEDLQASAKGNSKFVKDSQMRIVENITRDLIRKKEDYSIKINKEFIHKASGDFAFIINPIDGIFNFERAIPFFAMVLAIEDLRDKSVSSSYIYAPALGSCYFAEKGKGAWVESIFDSSPRARRLRVSQNNTSSTCLYLQDFLDNDNVSTENLRMIGSFAVAACMIASGKADKMTFKAFNPGSAAAAKLLINEAGGKVEEEKTKFIAFSI